MKIEINNPRFEELAVRMNIRPEKLVESIVEHAAYMSIHARSDVINGRSLDSVLADMFENALPGLILNEVIRDIVGEHDYIIDDGGYSREDGIIYVQVSFLEGTILNMGSITLQFGKDPGIVASEYMDVESSVSIGHLASQIEEEIDGTDPTFDLDTNDSISIDDMGDDSIVITLQINWRDELDLPRVAEIDEIMRKIKERIHEELKSANPQD